MFHICHVLPWRMAFPFTIPLKEANDFRLTAEELEAAITPSQNLIITLITTAVMTKKEDLEAIAEVIV